LFAPWRSRRLNLHACWRQKETRNRQPDFYHLLLIV
jgi:hypothetical protein